MAKMMGKAMHFGAWRIDRRGAGAGRAAEAQQWKEEAERDAYWEQFFGYHADAKRHLMESGADDDVAESMATLHALNAMKGRL